MRLVFALLVLSLFTPDAAACAPGRAAVPVFAHRVTVRERTRVGFHPVGAVPFGRGGFARLHAVPGVVVAAPCAPPAVPPAQPGTSVPSPMPTVKPEK
jgi:hypothetical protein